MKIPTVGQFMMDMMVMALACEKTAVISLQWTDTEAKHTFPWLNLSEHHHFYQHDGGFRPTECTQIDTWYSQMHLALLQKMQAVDMGGHSLLDESVVMFGSEIADPPSHAKNNMPILLAGGTAPRCGRAAGSSAAACPQQVADVDLQPVRRHAHQLRRLAPRLGRAQEPGPHLRPRSSTSR